MTERKPMEPFAYVEKYAHEFSPHLTWGPRWTVGIEIEYMKPLYTAEQIRAMVEEVRAESSRRASGWTIPESAHRSVCDALDAILARLEK